MEGDVCTLYDVGAYWNLRGGLCGLDLEQVTEPIDWYETFQSKGPNGSCLGWILESNSG